MTLVRMPVDRQARLRSACFPCHRRKVRCVRSGESCASCLRSNIACRFFRSLGSVVGSTQHYEQSKRKRRGPYKKGKTPREKELEDVVANLTAQCQDLQQQLEARASSDASDHVRTYRDSSANSATFQYQLSRTDVDVRHAKVLLSPRTAA